MMVTIIIFTPQSGFVLRTCYAAVTKILKMYWTGRKTTVYEGEGG